MSNQGFNNDKPIRIAEVLGKASVGGVINWLINFYRHVDRNKVQFDFYTYDESPFDDEIRALGGRVFRYPNVMTNTLGAISKLKRAFKREGYSIVHVHMTTLSFVALYAAKRAGVKHRICHAHSTANKSEGWKWIIKEGLRPLATVFATELAGCSMLSIDWLYRSKAENARLIHNAIDVSRFEGAYATVAAADDCDIDGETHKTIGFIGRFEHQKNVGYLIEVFKDITKVRDDIKLLLVGKGSEHDSLVAKVKKLEIEDKVEFRAWSNSIEESFAAIDVLALPSFFEGLPIVAVEAQAAGVPLVMSDNITTEVALTPNCEFIPLADRARWAEALIAAADGGREYGHSPLKGSDYDIETEAMRLTDYYLDIAGKGERNNAE